MANAQVSTKIDEALIGNIVQRVLSVSTPDRIILFGSAVASHMTRDSDIDLLVVESQPKDRRRESVLIGDALRGMGFPFDVLVISTEWFEASKNVIGGIAYRSIYQDRVLCGSRRYPFPR